MDRGTDPTFVSTSYRCIVVLLYRIYSGIAKTEIKSWSDCASSFFLLLSFGRFCSGWDCTKTELLGFVSFRLDGRRNFFGGIFVSPEESPIPGNQTSRFFEGTLWYKLFWITNFLPPFSFCPPSIFFRISFDLKLSQRGCFSKQVVEIETRRVAVITSGRVGTKFELLSPVPTKSSSSLLPQQPTWKS